MADGLSHLTLQPFEPTQRRRIKEKYTKVFLDHCFATRYKDRLEKFHLFAVLASLMSTSHKLESPERKECQLSSRQTCMVFA